VAVRPPIRPIGTLELAHRARPLYGVTGSGTRPVSV